MKTTNNNFYKSTRTYLVTGMMLLFYAMTYAQQTPVKDSTSTTFSFNKMLLPNPNSILSKYTYDPISDRYIYTENLGNLKLNYPVILTPEEFRKLVAQENMRKYYKEKIDAQAGQKDGLEDAKKNLIPELYVNSDFFESVFGGNTIEVIPQGSIEMDLGILYSKQDNPAFSPRNRSNFTFDFDQRIELSLLGKVGTRLQVTANYDTQSTFDFQNVIKLEYTPTEDDIIQKIEVGNVNMPLNNSLITGAQSLFGVKTQLKFGKTRITGIFSEQRSETRTVAAQGGGALQEFEFFGLDYDENRHFFLGHYFRDNYDKALETYPYVNSLVNITRIEVWVTNRSNQTDNVRNIVALQDIGESDPSNVSSSVNLFAGPGAFPNNENNAFDPTNIGGPGSQLNSNIRDIAVTQSGFTVAGINEGIDYGKLESARKLQEGTEFTFHEKLGYISLNQRLQNDEILAVAYQYTIGNEVYQVGEFANDGVDATEVTDTGSGTNVVNQSLVLKMLKSTVTNVEEPIWDLMMKNIYQVPSAFQLKREDFKLNIFYTETSPLNYISPVGGSFGVDINGNPITGSTPEENLIQNAPLLRLFNLDKLNYNNDQQYNGDGFFDFVPGITVIQQNGKIIFTNVEPFGRYLFDVLDDDGNPGDNESDYNDPDLYNPNQAKYVYDKLYNSTKTAALEESEKNKFQMKGRYKSEGAGGIPIGAFNVPRGSVKVTAGGRILVEGVDYTVDYLGGTVQILDPALQASNTPIQVSVENNSVFGQQTKRFTGINVEHQFNENFMLGATFLNLNERPLTQKANYGTEPINNTILGFNGNFSTEVPFLTRLANKLPNIDTDVPSNLSLRGEFAYLLPGAPKGTDFGGEATSYIDDFEGNQNNIDLLSPITWNLSSRPKDLGRVYTGVDEDDNGIQNGYDRALLNWYTIDPVFYSGSRRPSGISDDDVSNLYTRRIFIDEIFPQQDIVQGQPTVINSLDLAYYPEERGPYNFQAGAEDGILDTPFNSWAGITRELTTTDFEKRNVEYIEFWLQDPYLDNTTNPGGKLVLNLGNISEDVIKDGSKQYENGLPEDGDVLNPLAPVNTTVFGSVVPINQALIYAFSTTGQERTNQDVGLDGYDDAEEGQRFPVAFQGEDPANDNYVYFLNTDGNIFERYKKYNGLEGNSPETVSQTNRGSTTEPDVEDINRDNTMNTIDSYFEYELDITRLNLDDPTNTLIRDRKTVPVRLPNGDERNVNWYQFRIPLSAHNGNPIGGIADFRSIRFMRMYLKEFTEATVLRFGSLDLVRSDWRRYQLSLDQEADNSNDVDTEFSVGIIGIQENDGRYVSPPGVVREQLNNNNNLVRQNEQSLVVNVCDLEPEDSRAVFKNISVDMRQFKKLRMFIHAEEGATPGLEDGKAVAFIRMGNDFTQNYYQIEIPLVVSPTGATTDTDVWKSENEINLPIEVLAKIKALGISNGTLGNALPTFYDVVDGVLNESSVDEFSDYTIGQHRVAIKGNPNFGDIRTLMVGVKNVDQTAHPDDICTEVWFNELRISDMDNEGGWAAIASMDANIADFMDITATGQRSTTGFGTIEQGPNQRSREDVKKYDVVTNVNLGQLLPKKWGIEIPFNYAQSEELITPEYDQQYKDIKLEDRLNAATSEAERETIREQSEDYTKRQSINFIGVKKNRTGEGKPRFYDVENLVFNYSYNKTEHRDFEIENSLDQNIRVGANYNFSFNPVKIEPFKKNDSLFTGKYWRILKDFNVNLLPTNISVNTDFIRQFNKQKFRDIDLGGGNIGLEELYRRNYTFDFQYSINYNLTNSLALNFSASNNNIVRNYFIDDNINGAQDPTKDVWDGFFDVGDPNRQFQQLGINYELPINKIPTFNFLRATYAYTGDFLWQKGNYENLIIDGVAQNTGNSVSNANSHTLNTTLDMNRLYRYLGLVRKRNTPQRGSARGVPTAANRGNQNTSSSKKNGLYNAAIDILTTIKRVQINYTERNGTFLPGYMETPGFIGTLKPSFGFTFGSQRDIRHLAARNGWLTTFPEFNQQYTKEESKVLDYSAALEPTRDLKIDLIGTRNYNENLTENFNATDLDNDGRSDLYNPLITNTFGNFDISTSMIRTAFSASDENSSATFDDFRANRLKVAQRLALRDGRDLSIVDADGFPVGYGKTNQAVLLPAFLAAYTGASPDKVKLGAFRDVPIPNWNLKYTGLMRFSWFKKRFKRFSLTHGYKSNYTISQFRTNLDYDPANPDEVDQNGNFKNKTLFSAVALTEMFSPLVKIDFEMKNSLNILAEVRKDRRLFLSFDNNLLTEIKGNEYVLGLGYRIKDVKINSKLAGRKQIIKSDLNMKADISIRDNKTIIRYLDLENNQVTAGQTIWGLKYTADYAFSKNLTGIFYFDYTFSEYAISTAFPQTSIRSGITLRYAFGN